jgi:elongator complex protein 1
MRNLSLYSCQIASFYGANICATAIDLDQNVLYAASERQNHDADVEIEIWKVGLGRTYVGNQVCGQNYFY